MRFHVTVQHRFVDATIIAFRTFERLGAEMIAQMIFQVMLIFGDKLTFRTGQQFFGFNMFFTMVPEIRFGNGDEVALLAFVFARFGIAAAAAAVTRRRFIVEIAETAERFATAILTGIHQLSAIA